MAWRMALPHTCASDLKDAEFRAAMQHRPGHSLLPASAVGPWCCCVGATGDVLLTLGSGMTVAECVGHAAPRAANRAASAASAEQQQQITMLKNAASTTGWHPMGTPWYPVLWPVGKACCRFSRNEAAAAGAVSKSSFVAAALREFSVGSCKGNYLMHQASLGVLAGVASTDL
jgi:hypothetical protein